MSPRERTSRQGDEARYLVPGLARGLEILRLFSRDRRAIAPPEMAKELGIPRSTVFRLVQTLEQMGFLERTEGGHAYRLGVAVLGLGFEYLASLEITELARPVLEQLRDDTGLTTHLVIRDGRDVVIVFKAVGRSRFTSSVNVGTRLPAHATVLGRVMLADLSDAELKALYRGCRLDAFSAQTPTTIEALRALVRRDGQRGHALSESFFESGVSAIAAPVRDMSGRVVAAINVTITGEAAGPDRKPGLADQVMNAAGDLSRALSYRPSLETAVNL